jgi:hypothetical protein
MEWMRHNVPTLTIDRQLYLDNPKKELFFDAVKKMAESPPDQLGFFHQMEKIRNGETAIRKLRQRYPLESTKRSTIADLLLIGLNHNEQYVSAIATNFRTASVSTKPKQQTSAATKKQ